MLGLGQWVEQCNLIMLAFQGCPIGAGHQAKIIDVLFATQCLVSTWREGEDCVC